VEQLAAQQGVAILAISSEVPELLTHADRIVVMKAGRIVGELGHHGTSESEVMRLAGGSG
jgi:ABC-type sugar transport system ATPase subunit